MSPNLQSMTILSGCSMKVAAMMRGWSKPPVGQKPVPPKGQGSASLLPWLLPRQAERRVAPAPAQHGTMARPSYSAAACNVGISVE